MLIVIPMEKIKLPIIPEYVLLGLILVNLGPLKILPNIYPPKSVVIETIIKNNKTYKPSPLGSFLISNAV